MKLLFKFIIVLIFVFGWILIKNIPNESTENTYTIDSSMLDQYIWLQETKYEIDKLSEIENDDSTVTECNMLIDSYNKHSAMFMWDQIENSELPIKLQYIK